MRLRAPTRTETTTPAGINLGIGAALVWRMTLLVAAGAAGLLVGVAHRQVRALRSQRRFDATLQVLVTHVDGEEKRDA